MDIGCIEVNTETLLLKRDTNWEIEGWGRTLTQLDWFTSVCNI